MALESKGPRKVEMLERLVGSLRREVQSKESQIKRLKVRPSLDPASKQYEAVVCELRDSHHRLQEAEQDAAELYQSQRHMTQELAILRRLCDANPPSMDQMQHAEMAVRCASLEEENRRMHDALRVEEARAAELRKNGGALREELATLRRALLSTRANVEAFEEELREGVEDRERFHREYRALRTERDELAQRNERLLKVEEELGKRAEEAEQEMSLLREKYQRAQEDAEHRRLLFEEMRGDIKAVESEQKSMAEEFSKLQGAYAAQQQQAEAQVAATSNLQKSLDATVRENESLHATLAKMERAADAAEARHHALALEHQQCSLALQQLKSQAEEGNAVRMRLERRCGSLEVSLEEATAKAARLAVERQEIQRTLEKRTEEAEAQRAHLRKRYAEAMHELRDAKERTKALSLGTQERPPRVGRVIAALDADATSPSVKAAAKRKLAALLGDTKENRSVGGDSAKRPTVVSDISEIAVSPNTPASSVRVHPL